MKKKRRAYGQVFQDTRNNRWKVKWACGKLPNGRSRYAVRVVSSEAKGLKFLEELRRRT